MTDAAWEETNRIAKQIDLKNAMSVVREAMKDDPGFAYSWHSRVALMCDDALCRYGPIDVDAIFSGRHQVSNDAASHFMKTYFDIETEYKPGKKMGELL